MTSTALLGGMMACAAVTIGTAIGWLLAIGAVRVLPHAAWSARSRAIFLAQIRVLPLACAAILVPAQLQAFLRFETSRPESAGPLLVGLAGVGIWLMLDAAWRGARMWRDTATIVANWRRAATPLVVATWARPAWAIRPAFPIVAVIGAFRPQLFVARQVVDRCTPAEMAAIAAHEAAHVAARDNLMRVLFAVTPGVRLCSAMARSIERQWLAASEEAADTSASAETDHLELASALTKVARLAPHCPPHPVAASTLIGASDLDARVRRLVTPPTPARLRRTAWMPTLLLLITAVASQLPAVGAVVHEMFELLVRSH